jgi:hypothetical protein
MSRGAKAGKPVTIGGVKTVPTWDWSPEYLAWQRQRARELTKPSGTARDIAESIAIKYARWLAARDGVDLSEATGADCVWDMSDRTSFIKAIAFKRGRWVNSWTANGRQFESEGTVTVIVIPNPDPTTASAWKLLPPIAA